MLGSVAAVAPAITPAMIQRLQRTRVPNTSAEHRRHERSLDGPAGARELISGSKADEMAVLRNKVGAAIQAKAAPDTCTSFPD